MQQLEIVVILTKNLDRGLEELIPIVSLIEIYPLGRAYGGRPLREWTVENTERKFRYTVGMFGYVSIKAVIKAVFKVIALELRGDPNAIYKIVVYKEHSTTGIERCFIWERGKPLETLGFDW